MKKLNKIFLSSFLLIGTIPILPFKLVGAPVGIFFFVALGLFLYHKPKNLKWQKLIVLTIPYWLLWLSVMYSDNSTYAIKKLTETRLSLFLIPLSFFLLPPEYIAIIRNKLYLFKKVFILCTVTFCCIYLVYLFFIPEPENPAFRFPSNFFFQYGIISLDLWDINPIYQAFLNTISLIFLAEITIKMKIRYQFAMTLFPILLLVTCLLVGKTSLIFIAFFTIWLIHTYIKNWKLKTAIYLLGIFLAIIFSKTPFIKYELIELEHLFRGKNKVSNNDSADLRGRILISSFQLLKESPVIYGLGIGDAQKELNKIYAKNEYLDLLSKNYNTHNQFIGTYLEMGIVGLFSIIFLFGFLFKICIKHKESFFTWLLFFCLFQMLTENVFERQLTVILYSFFFSTISFILPVRGSLSKN